MKIRCSCGVKYEFDVTPEMGQNPVKFICTNCGLDSSEYVNQLVREELAELLSETAPAPQPSAPPPSPPPASVGSRLKINREQPAASSGTPPPAPVVPSAKYCHRHHAALAADKCFICGKPMCLKCMEEFGYVCSPFCRNKADQQGIEVPVFGGQKFEVQRKFWAKTGLVIGGLVGLVVLFFAVWTWYAWFGAVPHKYFAVRFEDTDRAYSGRTQLVGKDQLVFLHGGTLARYDLKTKKPVWTVELISKEDIAAAVKKEQEFQDSSGGGGGYSMRRNPADIERDIKIGLQRELLMRVSGKDIWIGKGDKLTHFDWDSGRPVREITLPEYGSELLEKDGELLMIGDRSITHVSLATGDSRVEKFAGRGAGRPGPGTGGSSTGGLFAKEGQDLDPNQIAAEAQNMKMPAKIALPALIASAQHNKQIEIAMRDDTNPRRPRNAAPQTNAEPEEIFDLVVGDGSYAEVAVRMLEERIVTRTAMKAPPKQSALNGNLNATQTAEVANELLNEMQRNSGNDKEEENESLYHVAIRLPDSADTPVWTNNVIGPPQLFVLKTVNVLVAGKTVYVLDKSNKKLWQSSLTYPVEGGTRNFFSRHEINYGEGPCVEHGDMLYIFDKAMLSAFNLSSGEARWRVPSVGVEGLFFDAAGDVYVNTTTASPDDIKFSRQIDVNKMTLDVVMKLDAKTGKTLWSTKPGGFISYLNGKYIYAVQSFDPNPTDDDAGNDMVSSLMKPPFVRIVRINPKNGRIMFEYYDRDRCPFDVRFEDNSIQLVFKREVQVLRYLSF